MEYSNLHYEGTHIPKEVPNGFEIYPAALNIVWGKDERYWKLPKGPNKEKDPAELIQVSWLEVTGWCDKVQPGKKYEVQFELKLTPDACGFNELPLYFMVKSGSKQMWKKIHLTKDANVDSDGKYTVPKNLVITITENKFEDSKLYFGIYEVWSGKWKGGLIIKKVIIKEKAE